MRSPIASSFLTVSPPSTHPQKLEKLQANLHELDAAPVNKRVVFVDDVTEANEVQINSRAPSSGKINEDASLTANVDSMSKTKQQRALVAKYGEVKQRENRAHQLGLALQRVTLQKALQGKGRRKKVKVAENVPKQFKWRQERKR